MVDQIQAENGVAKPAARRGLRKLGLALVILSFVLYGFVLLVPFTPYSTGNKTIIITILIISGEASFWVGGIILGREIIVKYKRYLNPLHWFKKKPKAD